jgi:hypothetical protein
VVARRLLPGALWCEGMDGANPARPWVLACYLFYVFLFCQCKRRESALCACNAQLATGAAELAIIRCAPNVNVPSFFNYFPRATCVNWCCAGRYMVSRLLSLSSHTLWFSLAPSCATGRSGCAQCMLQSA